MRLLVVGASGFIGTNFLLFAPPQWQIVATYNKSTKLKRLIAKKKIRNVKLIRCNLTKIADVKKLAKIVGSKPINVLYLAGNSDPQFSYQNPVQDLEQNVFALINFLAGINVEKIVYFSSGAVYDGISGKVNPNSKLDPKLPYAISKLAAEQYVKHFHKKGTVKKYVIIRFFGAYGPFEPERKIYTKLVKAFNINKQNTFTVYGNGKNLIDAMYVNEVIRIILVILTSKKANLTIDVCHGKPLTINELVKKAAAVFGIQKVRIKHFGKSAEPIHFRPNQESLYKYFKTRATDNLGTSLKKLVFYLKPL